MNLQNIPPELQAGIEWVCYRHEKSPVDPKTGRDAKANEPCTWGTLAQAVKHREAHKNNGIAGIGREFNFYDPFCGIDLDHCRDPETKKIAPWALEIIKRFNSYTEISPSGTGVHIWIKAKFPKGAEGNQKNLEGGGKIEVYDVGRYFTVTGHHLEGTPATVEARDKELKAFHAEVIAKPKTLPKTPGPSPTLSLADSEIIEKARIAENESKFNRLMRGDTSEYDGDDNRADLALCSILAFYTQDPEQIDRLFRTSGLFRDKWERQDYRDRTIKKALHGLTETYQGPQCSERSGQPKARDPGTETPGQERTTCTPSMA